MELGFGSNNFNFSTTSLSTIRLEANASDPDGSLEGVRFYVIDVTNDINSGVQYAWTGELDFNVDAGGTTNGVPADGDLLTIDDGTGKAATFEFDSDSSVLGGAAPTVSIPMGIN